MGAPLNWRNAKRVAEFKRDQLYAEMEHARPKPEPVSDAEIAAWLEKRNGQIKHCPPVAPAEACLSLPAVSRAKVLNWPQYRQQLCGLKWRRYDPNGPVGTA